MGAEPKPVRGRTRFPRWRMVLRRWISAGIVASMTAALFLLVAPAGSSLLPSPLPAVHKWTIGLALFVGAIAAGIVMRKSLTWARARNQIFNPGPLLVFSIWFLFVIQFWASVPMSMPEKLRPLLSDVFPLLRAALIISVVVLAVAAPCVAWLVTILRRTPLCRSEKGVALEEFGQIRAWLRTDDEVRDPSQDAFGHVKIARRMAERLSTTRTGALGRGATFALLGEIGSGKSSIRELVRHHLAQNGELQRHIVFSSVSLWPFESTEAAIRGTLHALEAELRRVTSTTSVRLTPTNYLKTIERFDRRLGVLSDLISSEEISPSDVLSGYNKLAALVGVQIVIWVEDLERFESSSGAPGAKVAPIYALLCLLQQFEHITVVLASNTLSTCVDIEKIARFVEQIPDLKPRPPGPSSPASGRAASAFQRSWDISTLQLPACESSWRMLRVTHHRCHSSRGCLDQRRV